MSDDFLASLGIEGVDLTVESEKVVDPTWLEHKDCMPEVVKIVREAKRQFKTKLSYIQDLKDRSKVGKKDYQLVVGNLTESVGLHRTYLKNRHQNKYQQLCFEFITELNERLATVFHAKGLKTKTASRHEQLNQFARLKQEYKNLVEKKFQDYAITFINQKGAERLKLENSVVRQLQEQNDQLTLKVLKLKQENQNLIKSLRFASGDTTEQEERPIATRPESAEVIPLKGSDT
ncbi:MAG: hypothetical protein ACPG4J_09950 [Lentibacter algarum]